VYRAGGGGNSKLLGGVLDAAPDSGTGIVAGIRKLVGALPALDRRIFAEALHHQSSSAPMSISEKSRVAIFALLLDRPCAQALIVSFDHATARRLGVHRPAPFPADLGRLLHRWRCKPRSGQSATVLKRVLQIVSEIFGRAWVPPLTSDAGHGSPLIGGNRLSTVTAFSAPGSSLPDLQKIASGV
jgi:hypothetical protein